MIITKENEIFQQLLADVEWLKELAIKPYYVERMNKTESDKYISGCDPVEKPVKFKTGDWVYRTVGKDDKEHAYGRIFKITVMGNKHGDRGVIRDDDGYTHFHESLRHATNDEVCEYLVAMARAKGYKDGMTIEPLNDKCSSYIRRLRYDESDYFSYRDDLDRLEMNGTGIYQNGQWAKIIKKNKKKLPKTKVLLADMIVDCYKKSFMTTDTVQLRYEVNKFLEDYEEPSMSV